MKITWIFDVISPFAYLNLKQLPRLPADVTVEYRPVLFAGILNHHGQIGNAEIPSKRRFTYRFALWRASKMGVPMRMPPAHPFNPLAALRLIIAAGGDRRATETIFDAVFMHGRNVEDPAVLADLGRELGISDVRAALENPEVKQQLRANTEWAISRGVFGVPTFVIGDELYWGHDAFDMVLDVLRDPAWFQSEDMRKIDSLPVSAARVRKG